MSRTYVPSLYLPYFGCFCTNYFILWVFLNPFSISWLLWILILSLSLGSVFLSSFGYFLFLFISKIHIKLHYLYRSGFGCNEFINTNFIGIHQIVHFIQLFKFILLLLWLPPNSRLFLHWSLILICILLWFCSLSGRRFIDDTMHGFRFLSNSFWSRLRCSLLTISHFRFWRIPFSWRRPRFILITINLWFSSSYLLWFFWYLEWLISKYIFKNIIIMLGKLFCRNFNRRFLSYESFRFLIKPWFWFQN